MSKGKVRQVIAEKKSTLFIIGVKIYFSTTSRIGTSKAVFFNRPRKDLI